MTERRDVGEGAGAGSSAGGGERKAAHRAGDTALVVTVPEAEALVGRWREREDGIPAHVTVLVPFLHTSRIDDNVRTELRALFRLHPAVDVGFRRVGRFPEVVYLAPEPAEPFVRLTEAVVARWPETPPYGGAYDTIIPHLTLGRAGVVEESALDGELPLTSRARAVTLLVCVDGERWTESEVFPLA
ncbi:2'-5' RNA ligase family protein [Nonomuraea sp. NPDC048882]|uniref:2'-5' RNA ligase family protein n=1 Tax=Nonomuraea sp. NPDC048882 TaxID=3154347 RepID=UPI0033DEE02D